MRVLIAPDKFAGTLTAVEAAQAIATGWARRAPQDSLDLVPMADGGPGFVDVLHASLGGDLLAVTVTGPYGDPVPGTVLVHERTAYVESAQACGLHLVPAEKRDPERATTRGVGELVAAAQEESGRGGQRRGHHRSAPRPVDHISRAHVRALANAEGEDAPGIRARGGGQAGGGGGGVACWVVEHPAATSSA